MVSARQKAKRAFAKNAEERGIENAVSGSNDPDSELGCLAADLF
jgi:hypothetical protein